MVANWGNLPKALAQLQFEGLLEAGEDTDITEKIMTANMASTQAVWVRNKA